MRPLRTATRVRIEAWRFTLTAGRTLRPVDSPDSGGWIVWAYYRQGDYSRRYRWLGLWLGFRTRPLWSEREGRRTPAHARGPFRWRFTDGWQTPVRYQVRDGGTWRP